METFINILQKVFIFDKEPQKIGLSQFKEETTKTKITKPFLKKKKIKISKLIKNN